MFKNLMNMKSKMTFARNQVGLLRNSTPKRMFSYQQMPSGRPGVGAMLGVGLGTAGLMYLMYQGRTLSMQRRMNLHGQQ
jgi:hypothetical protein